MTKSTTLWFPSRSLNARRVLPASVQLAAAVSLCAAAPGSLIGQEQYRLAGSRVAVYNLAGEVNVVPGQGSEVVVEVARGGSDASRLSVATGRIGGTETLRVIYPDDRVVYRGSGRGSNTSVRVRSDGTFYGGRGGGDRVRISGRGGGLEDHADLVVRVPRGVEVAIHLAVGEGNARNLAADLTFNSGAASVDVAEVEGNVSVDTGSGALTITDVTGDVIAHTGAGAITLEGISGSALTADTGSGSVFLGEISAARVTADTGSGSITGRALSAEELLLDTGSGRIEVEDLDAARISCDSGSGAVRLGLAADVDRLIVETGSGGVAVTVPEDFGAVMELDSGSGSVSVDVPRTEVAEAKRRYFRGTVGDGEGRVVIETGSGGISVRPS